MYFFSPSLSQSCGSGETPGVSFWGCSFHNAVTWDQAAECYFQSETKIEPNLRLTMLGIVFICKWIIREATLGREKHDKCFNKCDAYCSFWWRQSRIIGYVMLRDLWRYVLKNRNKVEKIDHCRLYRYLNFQLICYFYILYFYFYFLFKFFILLLVTAVLVVNIFYFTPVVGTESLFSLDLSSLITLRNHAI